MIILADGLQRARLFRAPEQQHAPLEANVPVNERQPLQAGVVYHRAHRAARAAFGREHSLETAQPARVGVEVGAGVAHPAHVARHRSVLEAAVVPILQELAAALPNAPGRRVILGQRERDDRGGRRRGRRGRRH